MALTTGNNLWASAWSGLSDSDRQNIIFSEDHIEILAELQRLVEESMDRSIEKRQVINFLLFVQHKMSPRGELHDWPRIF